MKNKNIRILILSYVRNITGTKMNLEESMSLILSNEETIHGFSVLLIIAERVKELVKRLADF